MMGFPMIAVRLTATLPIHNDSPMCNIFLKLIPD